MCMYVLVLCACVCVCMCIMCVGAQGSLTTLTKYGLIYISSHHKDPNLPWYSEEQCWLHLFNGFKQGTLRNEEQGRKEQEEKSGNEEDRERRGKNRKRRKYRMSLV